MTKTRVDGGGVRWTDPTGRSWTSPTQRPAPSDTVREPAMPAECHSLSPDALAELLAQPDTDPIRYELRAVEHDPTDTDRTGEAICDDDGWGLALDDPYRWTA